MSDGDDWGVSVEYGFKGGKVWNGFEGMELIQYWMFGYWFFK